MDLGCYAVNLIRFLFGSEPKVVEAQCNVAAPNIDRSTTATLQNEKGIRANFKVSLSAVVPSIYLRVSGSQKGKLSVTNWACPHIFYNSLVWRDPSGKKTSEIFGKQESTYVHQLRAFVRAVNSYNLGETAEVITDASDAVRNMAIVDEIYQKMGLAPRQGIFHGEPSLLHTSPRASTHEHSLSYESSGNKTQFSVEDEPPFGATQVTNAQHVELDQSSPVMKEASESDLDVRAHTEAN